MYCQRCGVHYSGLDTQGRCPYCGEPGEATKGVSEPSAPSAARPDVASSKPSSPHVSSQKPGLPNAGLESAVSPKWVSPSQVSAKSASPNAVPPRSDPDRTRTEAANVEFWLPGTVIAGKYEVLLRLGAGGFGTVYKVRHVHRKKYYALKTPHIEFARDEVFLRRFEREIEAMERFVHPDVVLIRDSGITEDGRPYYTMDFIEGESLKAVIQREGRFPADRAVHMVTRILRVLDVAHAHSIIHRDIKPDNILLTRVGGRETVKVLDFGVAKLLDLVGESGSITHGERVGTPKYMSPEQITGELVDARSDIFSLGILFYEMVTGQHPFAQVRDPIRVTAAILNREPTPPRELVPELPRAVSDLILSMLEKRVKRRPAAAGVILKQLQGISGEVVRVELHDRLEVCPLLARAPATPVVLCQETSAGERRAFLFFDERVSFGRSNDPERGTRNQILLRCLPCRSQAQDVENWQKNLTISHVVGSIVPDGSSLVIDPAPGAVHGIGIAGVRSHRTARLQSDRFAISIGDHALELDGYRILRSNDGKELDLRFLEDQRPPGLDPPTLTGYSNRNCMIDCGALFRTNNWPLHEYYLVYRCLKMGSGTEAPLRLRGKGVAGVHAAVIFEGGESFLVAHEPGMQVVGCRSGDRASGAAPEVLELEPRKLLPLRPGMEILLGDNHLFVEAVADSHFKTT